MFLGVIVFADWERIVNVLITATGSSSFDAFPKLVIDQDNVSESWENFSQDFVLALDARYTIPGTKMVALLKAVG